MPARLPPSLKAMPLLTLREEGYERVDVSSTHATSSYDGRFDDGHSLAAKCKEESI